MTREATSFWCQLGKYLRIGPGGTVSNMGARSSKSVDQVWCLLAGPSWWVSSAERLLMEFRIWVEVRLADHVLDRKLVAQVKREATGIGPEEIGLTLEEGKTVLNQMQVGVIHAQVEALSMAVNCKPLSGTAFSAGANNVSRIDGSAA